MERSLDKYAELVLKKGINFQSGGIIKITATIEGYDLAKKITEKAYQMGAKKVKITWRDIAIERLHYEYQDLETLKEIPDYRVQETEEEVDQGIYYIFFVGEDPDGLNGIPSEKIMAVAKENFRRLHKQSEARMSDHNSWNLIGVPTQKWAEKVFPESDTPMEDLWEAVLKTVRCDKEDPIAEWDEHIKKLKTSGNYLTEKQFDYVHFTSSNGTDIKVGLPKNHFWKSGGGINQNTNLPFVANMPTEEVYTMPHKNDVNGIVYSSKPLNYQGNIIDEFFVEFKDGKVTNFGAKKGEEILKGLIETDEGSCRLGEVALVGYHTPISLSGILYYSTLFDENASCHLALGRAYPTTIKGGPQMTREELDEAGCNHSAIHVDFMFGTKDTNIVGVVGDEKTVIFENGDFVI